MICNPSTVTTFHTALRMYYNDEARSFNFLSGLLCGSVLGAGLAMLVAPQKGVRLPDVIGSPKRGSRSWRPVIRVVRGALR